MICVLILCLLLLNPSLYMCTGDISCDQLHLGHLGHGVLTSYNFPFDYHHNLSCTHRIHFPDGFSNLKVCFTFYRFSLETSTPFCYFDHLQVKDTKYCGLGDWQFGYQEDELLSNLFEENFCWSVTKNTFDVVFKTDDSVTSSGFYATYNVVEENATAPNEPTRQDYAPCPAGYWTCFNRKCILASDICNGQDNCGDGSDESYAHTRCGEENVLACDFSDLGDTSDGYCGFTHESWFRTKDKIINGPAGDHTNGSYGHYVYTDTDQNYGARLLSPAFTPKTSNSIYCLTFWYYMYGSPAEAILDVFIRRDQTYSRPEWSRENAPPNRWLQGQITFMSQALLQVIFAAKLKNNFSGVALDDISILEGTCIGGDIACNFESSFCGWSTTHELDHSEGQLSGDILWKIHKYQEYPVGPSYDQSSRDGDNFGGYYTYINYTTTPLSASIDSHRALLVSPPVTQLQDTKKCLQFSYHMLGEDADCCVLKVKLRDHNNVLSDAVWSRTGDQRNEWITAGLQIQRNTPYQVVLEGWVSQKSQGEIALDHILLESGDCQVVGGSGCTEGQYLCTDGSCVEGFRKCDGHQDCTDGSDEDFHASCPSTTPTPATVPQPTSLWCSAGHFLCRDGEKCIKEGFLCDGFTDCADASDESITSCASTVGAGHSTSSLPPPVQCASTKHRCEDGQCLDQVTICDGLAECRDNSDEYNCTAPCLSSEFQCRESLLCVVDSLVCDNNADCSDGSDEESCLATVVEPVTLGAGPAVGIALGVLAVLLLVVLVFVLRRRRQKQPPPHSDTVLSTISYNSDGGSRLPADVIRDTLQYHPDATTLPSPDTSQVPNGNVQFLEEAPPPYDSVVKEQQQRRLQADQQVASAPGTGLSEWPEGQRHSTHRNTLPGLSVNRNQSWRGGSSRHARVPNNNLQSFISGLEPRPLHSNENGVDHSRPHLVNPYAVRNYVPDPTVNTGSHNRMEPWNSGVRRSAQRIPGIYPNGPHRVLNRPPKLGTQALGNRRKVPANYINQHSYPPSGYDSDSTVPPDHIYETLNLQSDSDRESHTLERRPQSSYLPRGSSSGSVNTLFSGVHLPHMNSDSSTTIRPLSSQLQYPPSVGSTENQPHSPTHLSYNGSIIPPASSQFTSQHFMGSPPHTTIGAVLPSPVHVTTPSGESQLTVPSSSSGYGSYNDQLASPGFSGQCSKHGPKPMNTSHRHNPPPQAVAHRSTSSQQPTQHAASQRKHSRHDSTISQTSVGGDKEHRLTPDSQSKLLPSSNNSSFDQSSAGHMRNDLNMSGVIFLPDMQQSLLNPTSV